MQPPARQISKCPTCGAALDQTFGSGGCTFCLLKAATGNEQETVNEMPDAVGGSIRFGVYEIDCHADGSLFELGRGAMGVTYRATDTSLQRKVALKIIKTEIAERSADARERFVREARSAAALRHENIAVIHQFGMRLETGQYFYAMELIEGETLDERVHRAGPLDARTTIGIAQQVTSALAAAEKHGLVHRDLKPANLMLVNTDDSVIAASDQSASKRITMRALRKSATPVVKIIDFGLAKTFHSAADPKSLTHDKFVGTPAFASPEQFEHSALDVRSDIYSLGETLWFALTGKTPFAGRTLSEIHRAQKSNALPVEQLRAAHVPHRLKSLLESMLAFQPASRPDSVELAARLKGCSPEGRKTRRSRVAVITAAIVVLGLAGLLLVRSSVIGNAASNPAAEKSIAVLPFENLSDDKENAYFAGGIQDDVLTNLSKIGDLKVISRTSTMQYKGSPRNVREIGRALDVATVLEGSVRRSGNRVRVNVQLIKTSNDEHIWAEDYDRDLTDIFAIQTDLALEIASTLQTKLSPREKARLEQRPTESGEAYLVYLEAQDSFTRSQSRNDIEHAAQLYERAIHLDPSFALALARLSYAESTLYQGTGDPALLAKARAAANEALRLQPALPEAHFALGYLYYRSDRDYERALRELAIAKAGLPNEADVFLVIGSIERRRGDWSLSTADLEKAASLSPKDASLWANVGSNYESVRNFPAAAKAFDRGVAVDPTFFMVRYLRARLDMASSGDMTSMEQLLSQIPDSSDPDGNVTLARFQLSLSRRRYVEALHWLSKTVLDSFTGWVPPTPIPKPLLRAKVYQLIAENDKAHLCFEEARQLMENAVQRNPFDPSSYALLGQVYAGLGLKEDAIRQGKRAVELAPQSKDAVDGPQMILALAQIYTVTGDLDAAIPLLNKSLATPGGTTGCLLKLDPVWDPLRRDPRFQKMIALSATSR